MCVCSVRTGRFALTLACSHLQQQRLEREIRKQQEREQRRRYEEMEQLRREEERRHAEREQVGDHATAQVSPGWAGLPLSLLLFLSCVLRLY